MNQHLSRAGGAQHIPDLQSIELNKGQPKAGKLNGRRAFHISDASNQKGHFYLTHKSNSVVSAWQRLTGRQGTVTLENTTYTFSIKKASVTLGLTRKQTLAAMKDGSLQRKLQAAIEGKPPPATQAAAPTRSAPVQQGPQTQLGKWIESKHEGMFTSLQEAMIKEKATWAKHGSTPDDQKEMHQLSNAVEQAVNMAEQGQSLAAIQEQVMQNVSAQRVRNILNADVFDSPDAPSAASERTPPANSSAAPSQPAQAQPPAAPGPASPPARPAQAAQSTPLARPAAAPARQPVDAGSARAMPATQGHRTIPENLRASSPQPRYLPPQLDGVAALQQRFSSIFAGCTQYLAPNSQDMQLASSVDQTICQMLKERRPVHYILTYLDRAPIFNQTVKGFAVDTIQRMAPLISDPAQLRAYQHFLQLEQATAQNPVHDPIQPPADELAFGRFGNVTCSLATVLPMRDDGTHGIHANVLSCRVPGRTGQPVAVAAQAPMSHQQAAFWESVHHNNIPLIVDLTNQKDRTHNNSERNQVTDYAVLDPNPEGGARHTYTLGTSDGGQVQITCTHRQSDPTGDFTTYTIQVQKRNAEGEPVGEPKSVKRIHYQTWPDYGVCDVSHLHRLASDLAAAAENGIPMAHCRAGVGRTGVALAAQQLLIAHNDRKLSRENAKAHIDEIILGMRSERSNNMVQESSQLKLLLDYVDFLLSGDEDLDF